MARACVCVCAETQRGLGLCLLPDANYLSASHTCAIALGFPLGFRPSPPHSWPPGLCADPAPPVSVMTLPARLWGFLAVALLPLTPLPPRARRAASSLPCCKQGQPGSVPGQPRLPDCPALSHANFVSRIVFHSQSC